MSGDNFFVELAATFQQNCGDSFLRNQFAGSSVPSYVRSLDVLAVSLKALEAELVANGRMTSDEFRKFAGNALGAQDMTSMLSGENKRILELYF